MKNDLILKVEDISKQYRLGVRGTGTVSHDLNRWWAKMRGKEDPFLTLGETNDRSTKGNSEYVWALKNINFDVKKGEVLGIIGKNGAGKSTLLKVLSQVTAPTTGSIKSKGRIASLLEVGTGFHPEMTGKENIYLNGAILGMTKKEITSKLDEIIAFSGCERYIDTPVKRYSSGMKVRLAFAVAAFLEPDILVVDEVLAVGDAEFQEKAIGKMQDISTGDGRTVLFVSHNMAAVKSLCTKTLVIENGEIIFEGDTDKGIKFYKNIFLQDITNSITWGKNSDVGNQNVKLISANILSETDNFFIEDDLIFTIIYNNLKVDNKINISISVFDENDNYVFSSPNLNENKHDVSKYSSSCIIPMNLLNIGNYYITILLIENGKLIEQLDKVLKVKMQEKGIHRGSYFGTWSGIVRPNLQWKNEAVKEN